MTKKDFELIARVVKAHARYCEPVALELMAREFANALKETNKQFNRDKFLRACGVAELRS